MIGLWLSDLPTDDPSKKSWSKPQLRRFVHSDKPIEFLELLGQGGEGVVYKVRIEGVVYALKMVSICFLFSFIYFSQPLSCLLFSFLCYGYVL